MTCPFLCIKLYFFSATQVFLVSEAVLFLAMEAAFLFLSPAGAVHLKMLNYNSICWTYAHTLHITYTRTATHVLYVHTNWQRLHICPTRIHTHIHTYTCAQNKSLIQISRRGRLANRKPVTCKEPHSSRRTDRKTQRTDRQTDSQTDDSMCLFPSHRQAV